MAASSSSSPFFGIRDDGGGGFFVHQMNQQQQQQQQQPPPQHHPQQLQTQPLVLQQQGNHLHLEHHRLLQQQQQQHPQQQQQSQQQQQQPEQQSSSTTAPSSSTAGLPAPPPLKKRRNLPGTPNVDAEVIALSPKTLMATNRFLCEVCGKGFQREQNLQLHRRGHNLPWKLKQKNPADAARRRVYVCPEPTCAHHDPSRALGDLTGIKKHFCRKHGEKKWKCDKCSKRYAVHSDWKAHSKTCGTREYRCDCGTLFSRRDSFITHRAFCDALAQESGRHPVGLSSLGGHLYGGAAGSGNLTGMGLGLSQLMNSQHQPSSLHSGGHDGLLRLGGGAMTNQFGHLRSSSNSLLQQRPSSAGFFLGGTGGVQDYSDGGAGGVSQQSHNMFETKQQLSSLMQLPNLHGHNILGGNSQQSPSAQGETGLFNQAGFFSGNTTSNNQQGVQMMNLPHNFNPGSIEQHAGSPSASALPRLNLTNGGTGGHQGVPPGLFGSTGFHDYDAGLVPAAMSATALLQKAAQMGSSMSGGGGDGQQSSSLFRGFASPPHSGNTKPMQNTFSRDMQFTFGGNGDAVFLSPQTQLEGMESNHLQDLMNSLVGNGVAPMPSFSHGGNETFTPAGMKADTKLHQRGMQGGGGMGSSDGLTRDFLGVGGSGIIVGGGSVSSQEQMPASEQQRLMRQSREDDVNVGSLFDETKVANTASRSRSFANESI